MPDPLDGLNDAQREAVTHREGPLLVVAGAGTGKTRTLTRRFAWLVEQGVEPDSILALTFSQAAAAEMRERLETLIEAPFEELWAQTFHGFCARLLGDEALETGGDPFLEPITPAGRLALLLDRVDEVTLRQHQIRGNPVPLLSSFISRIDRLKDEMVSAADYRAYAEALDPGEDDATRATAAREVEFASIYEAHERMLADAGALDFGDLILRAYRLLHEHPHVRARTSERFGHVLVDEYQDTNFAQGVLLRLLVQDHRNVWAVGDDDQAIYRFRGASQKNLRDFEREYPDARLVRLEQNYRSGQRILTAATAVVEGDPDRIEKSLQGASGGVVDFWRCRSDRAQAQAAAAHAEQLIVGEGVTPGEICILVRSINNEGQAIAAALEERGLPFRLAGAAAYFQRAEIRDLLAWLRLLADPNDSGAVVRALSRPPIELRSVDLARLTQLARRRKLDMVSAVATALDGPQLSPEGRDRAQAFLKLQRSAAGAFEEMRPDAFVHRLIERVGIRRQQLFAAQADTLDRLVNIAKLAEIAAAYGRRQPNGTPRDFAHYIAAVAESGLREDEAVPPALASAVQVRTMHSAKGLEFDHVLVLGLTSTRMPGAYRRRPDEIPDELLKEELPEEGRAAHEGEQRRLLHVAMTRARSGLVLAWPETGARPKPSSFYEEARTALEAEESVHEEELFGPGEGLHSTFRMMRDELLDSVSRVGSRLGELRLDTYLDVAGSVTRYLELLKVAALIERSKHGQPLEQSLGEVNELLLQAATSEQRELFETSALDAYLLDTAREEPLAAASADAADGALDSFIPRRGEGLMLSASDIETYRMCPLKYKFARVFRIPQEPTINQRFGIVMHQVLERFHAGGGGSLEQLMALFEDSWRRGGFGDSNDDMQFHARAIEALERYWELDQERTSEPVWFERSFSFKLGPHLLRGRVDRVDRLADGNYELIDYKTGKPKTARQLREDVQLSVYQMGARESWQLETSAQSYYYVLENEKVPVEHSEEELDRVRETVSTTAERILEQEFEPTPSPAVCPFCDYRIICPAAEK